MLPASIEEGRMEGEHFVQWWRVAQNLAETLRITGAQQRAGPPYSALRELNVYYMYIYIYI